MKVRCIDGSDRHCYRTISVNIGDYLPIAAFCKIEVVQEDDEAFFKVEPDEDWCRVYLSTLPDYMQESVAENGHFLVEIEELVCGACGSSETYDDEGRNITGR